MRLLLTGASAAALTALSSGAFAQQAGAGATEPTGAEAETVERGADQITCLDITLMDTALVPGVLYFVAGHREGVAGDREGAATVLEDPEGELPGMEDATVAQERRVADDEPGPAVAGTEADPALDDVEIAEDDDEERVAEDDGEERVAEDDGEERAAEDDGEERAAEDDATAPETAEGAREAEQERGEADGPAVEAQVVRVRGHFEIPIERTVLACAEDPDALLADVIEAQRQGAMAEEAVPEEDD
jgi:hypothetical protein